MRSFIVVFAFLWSVSICSAQMIFPQEWQSKFYADNPLVGTIFDAKGRHVGDENGWIRLLTTPNFVLLGEIHDNPDHHIIQAGIIREMVRYGSRPSIVFEMVPQSYGTELARYDLEADPELNDFADRLDWEKRGWYSWDIYRPIALAAAANKLEMKAGNLDTALTRKISKRGVDVLPNAEQQSLGLDAPFDNEPLLAELAGSHCGMMPAKALPNMATVQRARDGSMARVLGGSDSRSVLIAGNGHVRKDRGVPAVLRHLLPGNSEKTIAQYKPGATDEAVDIKVRMPNSANVSVGILEVREGAIEFSDYATLNEKGEALYDYVIFTPKYDITDHCAALREQFKKLKKTP